MSHAALNELMTPLTSFERMPRVLSHSHGTPGTCSVICLSIWPNACERSPVSVIGSAVSIAASTALSRNCGQLTLLVGRMFVPLNVGSSIEAGSGKSFCHPTLGQIATFCAGTWQNFVYIESRVTCTSLILTPSATNAFSATWAASFVGAVVVRDHLEALAA